MKKTRFIIALVAAMFAVGAMLFVACEKEKDSSKGDFAKSLSCTSYTGETYQKSDAFVNPYDFVGQYHNIIMELIDREWIPAMESGRCEKLLDFIDNRASQLPRFYGYTINLDQLKSDIRNKACSDEFWETLSNIPECFDEQLVRDIMKCFDGVEDTIALKRNIDMIAECVYNSSYSEDVRSKCLIYCAVYKYSALNLIRIYMDTSSNFRPYLGLENGGQDKRIKDKIKKAVKWVTDTSNWGLIGADAAGAVDGGAAGSAVGPVGTVLGAVVGGGAYTTMEALGERVATEIHNKI